MKAIVIPAVLLILGIGGGAGAGLLLAPDAEETKDASLEDCADPETMTVASAIDVGEEREYAKLNNQFVVPVVSEGQVDALVVLSLNLEVTAGSRTAIFAAEPKLRDRFLQVLFDHANTGGFSGNFTTGSNMRVLRDDLLRAARDVSGERVTDVLVIDIVRQDT